MKRLNQAEQQLKEELRGEGWEVLHRGWPDFICVRGERVIFVEVKPYRGEMLKREQHFVLTTLAKLGLECYKWTPEDRFEQIHANLPFDDPNTKKPRGKRGAQPLTPEETEEALALLPDEDNRQKFRGSDKSVQRWVLDHLRAGKRFYW